MQHLLFSLDLHLGVSSIRVAGIGPQIFQIGRVAGEGGGIGGQGAGGDSQEDSHGASFVGEGEGVAYVAAGAEGSGGGRRGGGVRGSQSEKTMGGGVGGGSVKGGRGAGGLRRRVPQAIWSSSEEVQARTRSMLKSMRVFSLLETQTRMRLAGQMAGRVGGAVLTWFWWMILRWPLFVIWS